VRRGDDVGLLSSIVVARLRIRGADESRQCWFRLNKEPRETEMHERKKLAVAIAVSLAVSGFSHAQTTASHTSAQKLERIEVTGSSIRRVDAEGPAPLVTITREMIEKSGQSTVSDILRSQTLNNGGAFDEKFTNSFAPGTSGVSLRGLGQNTTLVLINGRRVANYAFAQNLTDAFVDLNSIPLAAIERIEILKDGASAIYGSDAIAGVINVILRRDFRGAEVTASYGQTAPYGDANETRTSLAAGYGDLSKDRFNAQITLRVADLIFARLQVRPAPGYSTRGSRLEQTHFQNLFQPVRPEMSFPISMAYLGTVTTYVATTSTVQFQTLSKQSESAQVRALTTH
jgi:outer membrane receptor protein involved in Fe transport